VQGIGYHTTVSSTIIVESLTVSASSVQINHCGEVIITSATSVSGQKLQLSDYSGNCQFYSESTCTTTPITAPVTATKSFSNSYYYQCSDIQIFQTISVNDINSNLFPVWAPYMFAGYCGDPLFTGFDHKSFIFGGKIGSYYHIFSNQYVVVNSLFGAANPSQPKSKSTISAKLGIRTTDFKISLDSSSAYPINKTLVYEMNNQVKHIKQGSTEPLLDTSCVTVTYKHPSVVLKTPHFELTASFYHSSNQHINTSYINFRVSSDTSDPTLLGGIIGDTLGPKVYKMDNDHLTTNLFSSDALSCKYLSKPLICPATSSSLFYHPKRSCLPVPNGYQCSADSDCQTNNCSIRSVCEATNSCYTSEECDTGVTCTSNTCLAPV